ANPPVLANPTTSDAANSSFSSSPFATSCDFRSENATNLIGTGGQRQRKMGGSMDRCCQTLAASTLTSTLKYSANLRISWRLNGFFPARTSEIVDLGISVSRLNCA